MRQYIYTMLRVVSDIERGEQFNVGVVLFSRPAAFIGARISCDTALFEAMKGTACLDDVLDRLGVLEAIAHGEVTGGPLALLDASERFHFLAAPTSTAIQPSPVHTGISSDPRATLDRLFTRLVLR
ncbi:MAG: DUF3037 domain-containing protein [Thermomicrobiales bacterium]